MDVLYPLPVVRRGPLRLLRWWESRRLVYNKVVGATGLFTLAGVLVFAPDRADLFGPELVVAVAVYGMLANACFSLGWLTELLARRVWGEDAPEMGPLLFRQGLIFSVGLTLLPLGLVIMHAVLRLIFALVT
jgi:hypothetical protein